MLIFQMHQGVVLLEYHDNQVRARQMMKYCLLAPLLQLAFLGPIPKSVILSEITQWWCAFPTAFVHFVFLLIICIHVVLWQ